MNERIGIYMRVFRNEPGIHAAVKSVLDQTYTNWKFYVVVNENTNDVIQSYAERDDRIQVIQKPDGIFPGAQIYLKKMATDNNQYVCTLDGDDTLEPDFIEKMLIYSKENQTDIVFCGFNVISPISENTSRTLTQSLIWNVDQISDLFIPLYKFFRSTWGVLYKSSVIDALDLKRVPEPESYGRYGGDTIFVFHCLYYAKKCGFLNTPLYNYHISATSDTYKMESGRLNSDKVLFSFVRDFLISKNSFGTKEDLFLHLVYGHALVDTVILVLQSKQKRIQLYNNLHLLLSDSLTKEALEYTPDYPSLMCYDDRTENLTRLLFINMSTNEHFSELSFKEQYDLYGLLGFDKKELLSFDEYKFISPFPNLLGLYHYGDHNLFFSTLLKILAHITDIQAIAVMIGLFTRVANNNIEKVLLISGQCIKKNQEILLCLHNMQFLKAIQLIKDKVSEDTEPPYLDELIQVWILCSASLELASDYVLAKKIRTEYLAKHDRKEEASNELKDLSDMGIADQETAYLSSLINTV